MSFAKTPQAAETYEIKTEAPQAAEQKREYKSFFFFKTHSNLTPALFPTNLGNVGS